MCNVYKSLKNSLDLTGSGFIDFFPGFQLAGHTSPCSSVNWNAWTNLRVSSTDLEQKNVDLIKILN